MNYHLDTEKASISKMLIVKYFTFSTKNISFCNATAARYFYGDVRHSQHLFNVMAGKIIVLGFGL